uniref:Uncharacterized protein n=1 Tax=Picea glauca TaxID=3330 RepID=A0A101M3R9_PICGL|nr:hypothetical protein ABT39_MTgene257 [Picea glauca]
MGATCHLTLGATTASSVPSVRAIRPAASYQKLRFQSNPLN